MALRTAAGTKLYIGPANSTADDSTAYGALTYELVGEVEDLSDFGDKANEVTFTSLGDRRVRKLKGSYNAGTLTATVGCDQADDGQADLLAAAASDDDYAFKVVYPDNITSLTASPPGSGSIDYFRAKVMGAPRNVGNAENVLRRKFDLGINSKIVTVAAT